MSINNIFHVTIIDAKKKKNNSNNKIEKEIENQGKRKKLKTITL